MSTFYDAGKYVCEITAQKLTTSKNGNYQVVIQFEPRGFVEKDGSITDSTDGYERSMYMALTEKAAEITRDKLITLGMRFSDWAQVDESHPECCSLIGETVVLDCSHEEWEGKVRERWNTTYMPREIKSVDAEGASDVQAQFGHLLENMPPPPADEKVGAADKPRQRTPQAKAESPAKPAADAETDDQGDDLPF